MAYAPDFVTRTKRDSLRLAQQGLLTSWSATADRFGVNRQTLHNWGTKRQHADWYRAMRAVFGGVGLDESLEVPPLTEFRKQYFGFDTPGHMQQWFDFIESNRISLILVPPEHAKTQSVGIDYPVWRICKDRNVRIMYVCSNQTEARKRLAAVQMRLADHDYYEHNPNGPTRSVIQDFGPFTPARNDRTGRTWRADYFTVTGSTSGEKDYTMQAIGLHGKIYGTRLDLVVLDDIVEDWVNEQEQERIISWLLQKVLTRLSQTGRIVIIGTRVHEMDIYAHMLDEGADWTANWAKMVMPAVLDDATNKVLWPEFWPYERLKNERMPPNMRARDWALIFQQEAIGLPGSPFPLEVLEASKNPQRRLGHIPEGLPVVIGVDPATEGTCAIVVLALDRSDRRRYVVDCIAKTGLGHREAIKSEILYAARRYGAVRARVEQNFAQLGDDPDLKQKLHNIGCNLEIWKTTSNEKYDPDWGVLGTAGRVAEGLFDIPDGPGAQQVMRPFVEELALWRAGRKGKQDRVMALWFADLSAERLGVFRTKPRKRPVPPWVTKHAVPDWVKKLRSAS